MERLHATVIASIKETFSLEHFERLLKTKAEVEEARASREAERSNLLADLPKLAAAEQRLVKRIATIEDDELVGALKTEWAEAKAQREQARAPARRDRGRHPRASRAGRCDRDFPAAMGRLEGRAHRGARPRATTPPQDPRRPDPRAPEGPGRLGVLAGRGTMRS
jgi:hypothetical protein